MPFYKPKYSYTAMSYYYTVREYASLKGFDLSLQEETEAVASATTLSNKMGIPINTIRCKSSNKGTSCYATRVLRKTFQSAGEN